MHKRVSDHILALKNVLNSTFAGSKAAPERFTTDTDV